MNITTHFKREEFACKDKANTPYPCKWIDTRLLPLCKILEKIRDRVGYPITITSGYRTPEYNAELRKRGLKAAGNSYHLRGMAADFKCRSIKIEDLYEIIESMIYKEKIHNGGLCLYNGHIHYDTGTARRWNP